ncbi:hypothetical protein PR202_ga02331 [Eleusine coracana subsp. coracana]|uniref:RING-type domain-containing protein n=1 Tax=Eleusine coracana subsp. coracana TaxID=191504 RepID=A0AAV5BLH1_ELECO|nr:hypothetical protein PR202_ga02331 [Eleusine coracana subsp. coracana]
MDMSRPPQLAGVSPAAVYFSNAGAGGNRRKRVRDAMAPPPAAAAKEEYVNLFSLQTQQQSTSSFANVAHFHNLENRVSSSPAPAATALVSTGLRLAFDEQQQHQLQFQQQHQDSSKQMMNNNVLRYSSSPPSLFASVSDELAAQVKQKRRGDRPVHPRTDGQGEQLRRAMADRLRRHNRAILLKADQSAARRLHEKAAEAEREARRCAELEERLVRLRGEAAAWQAKALSEQAAAVTLHAQLQQAAAAAAREEVAGEAGPAESSCSAHVDPRRAAGCSTSDRACLGCRLRPASVVLLPCRHLSLCGECFAAGDAADVGMACPVCLCVRTGSVEAILC